MPTWQTIFGVGDPVVGDVAAFQAATDQFATMTQRAHDVAHSVHRLASQSSVYELQGQAGDAFRTMMTGVDGAFADVPAVVGQVHGCLQVHTTTLRNLRKKADEALARAEAKWHQVQSAEQDAANDKVRVSQLQGQLTYLRSVASPDDPSSMSQVTIAETRLNTATAEARASRQTLTNAQRELDDIGDEWKVLRDDEANLNRDTAHWLRHIDLRGLADKSLFEQVLTELGEFALNPIGYVIDNWEEIRKLALDALWVLKEALEIVAVVLAVVALVVLVLGLAVPGLNVAILALAAVLLATNLTLFFTQHPSPFDGEKKVTGADVWWSVLAVATAGLGPLASSLGKAATTTAQMSMKLGNLRSAASFLRIADDLRWAEVVITGVGVGGDGISAVGEIQDIRSTLDGQPHPYQILLWPFRSTPSAPPVEPRSYESSWFCEDLLRPPDPWDRAIATGQCRLAPVNIEEVLR